MIRPRIICLGRGFFEKGITVFIDTSGFAPWERFEKLLPYVTAFLYDIKAMNPDTHKKWVGVDNGLILENLQKLSAAGADIRLRLPLISGINDRREDLEAVFRLLREGRPFFSLKLSYRGDTLVYAALDGKEIRL